MPNLYEIITIAVNTADSALVLSSSLRYHRPMTAVIRLPARQKLELIHPRSLVQHTAHLHDLQILQSRYVKELFKEPAMNCRFTEPSSALRQEQNKTRHRAICLIRPRVYGACVGAFLLWEKIQSWQ